MPLPRSEVDATTPKYLRDKYAIVGVGETTYTRGSGRTTRALGSWAVRNAMLDAGLKPGDIDLFELHDAFSIMSALSLEAAGFAERGQGVRLAMEEEIGIEGKLPICTMGGLKGRGRSG